MYDESCRFGYDISKSRDRIQKSLGLIEKDNEFRLFPEYIPLRILEGKTEYSYVSLDIPRYNAKMILRCEQLPVPPRFGYSFEEVLENTKKLELDR